MVRLAPLFKNIQKKRILVAGDFILDRYAMGKSKRISPEAPVPVVLIDGEDDRAGGAGNVVLNLTALGMAPIPFGVVGDDASGRALLSALQAASLPTEAIIVDSSIKTPLKLRVIAGGQQVVRVDYEKPAVVSSVAEKKALEMILPLVQSVDAIAISDYAKGFLSDAILKTLIEEARRQGVSVICDPKGTNFTKYSGVTVLKPNFSEALAASGLPNTACLKEMARAIFTKVSVDCLMVTRSEAGISLYFPDGREEDHAVSAKEVRDVTGAGDTVLAMLAAAVANGLSVSDATDLANIAASCAIEHIGCATITFADVARRLIDQHSEMKVFSQDNVSVLHQALADREFLVVELQPTIPLDTHLFKKIRDLGKNQKELVVTLPDGEANEELIQTLVSLRDVDYIFLKPSVHSVLPFSISADSLVTL